MPFKNLRKSREYFRLYMRKLRANKKGLTSKTPKLNPVKPVNVKPEPCPHCRTLAEVQKAYENLQHQIKVAHEAKKEYWRQQKRKEKARKSQQKN